MSKPRLFVFGDSWSFNYFSDEPSILNTLPYFGDEIVKGYAKVNNNFGHWIDHMNNFYNVISYGVAAASNEQILYQIGNLNKYSYTNGDRVIVIFTTPERFNVVKDKKIYNLASSGTLYKLLYRDKLIAGFFENQFIERYERWTNPYIEKDEKLLIHLLYTLLNQWNPIFYTWSGLLDVDVVTYKPINPHKYSIKAESSGVYDDWHLGVKGNYKLFKLFAKWLNIDISNYVYTPLKFKVNPI